MSVITRAVRRVDPVCFAMVMATGIVSAALRQAGQRDPAVALLVIAVVCLVTLAAAACWRAVAFPADLRAELSRPDRAFTVFAVVAALAAWSGGVALYLVIMALVLVRLRLAGLGPADATAPYWVAMGAASISAFAAGRILSLTGATAVSRTRPVVTVVATCLWAIATGLIPALITLTTARWPRPPRWPRYGPSAWVVVFPLGMYAAAGLQLGTAARLPWMHGIGAAAVWPAAAAWVLTFTSMAISPLMGNHHEAIQVPGAGHAGPAWRRRCAARPARPDLPDGGPGAPSGDRRCQDVQRPGQLR